MLKIVVHGSVTSQNLVLPTTHCLELLKKEIHTPAGIKSVYYLTDRGSVKIHVHCDDINAINLIEIITKTALV